MKRIHSLLLLVLAGSLLFSCDNPKEQDKPGQQNQEQPQKVKEATILTLSGTKNYSAEPQNITLTVACDITWDVTLADASWAKIVSKGSTGTNAGQVVISLAMNRTQEARKQKVTLKAGTKSVDLEIEQAGLSSVLNKEAVIITGTDPSTINVSFKQAWTLSITDNADWFSASPMEGDGTAPVTVTLTPVDGNVNVGERSAGIEISVGGEKIKIPVVQGQTDAIVVSVNQFILDGREQNQVVPTETNVTYNVRIPAEASWISEVKASATKGLNKHDVVLHLESNTTGAVRKGTVYFEKDTVSRAVILQQAPYYSQLEETVPGFYGADENIVYRQGIDQIAYGVRNNSRYFSLLDPENTQVYSVKGIPVQDPQLCDSFDVTIEWKTLSDGTFTNVVPLMVVGVSETRMWLAAANGEILILNK